VVSGTAGAAAGAGAVCAKAAEEVANMDNKILDFSFIFNTPLKIG
jgi:hypothetical protein